MFFVTVLFVFDLILIETARPEGDLSECLIRNQKYKQDYLYTTNKVYVYKKKPFYMRKTNLMRLDKVDNFGSLRWSISKAFSNDTYFIKSHLYPGNYLCAIDEFQDLFNMKRSIQRLSVASDDLSQLKYCEWKFVRSEPDKQSYRIWNQMFKQKLYAAKSIYTTERNIYLWYY